MADRISGATTPVEETNPSMTSLVSGIVADLQRLLRQEMELARTEVRQEWDKAKTAAGALAAGAALFAVAGLLLCFMFVHLVHYFGVPLWGCFGIVGGVLLLAGVVLAGTGYARARSVHVVPPQTVETLKENVQWIKNQT
jgi:Flp pilus assembly protein TadB